MLLACSQLCTANLLAKKHHHKHAEVKQEKPPTMDELKEAAEDPNEWGAMDRDTLDAEFPAQAPGSDGEHHSGIYDFRQGHFAILDTPQKMDPEWQAEQHLKAVNALSGRSRHAVMADDDDDDE